MANSVIDEILRQGANQPRRYVLAALTTGRVESNFTNPAGGDQDSVGWRQERASLYRNPRNLRASVRRFYREAAQHDRGQSVGELAADVQRPAAQFRGRYAQALPEARRIFRRGGLTGGGGGSTATTLPSTANVAELLSSLGVGARQRPAVTAPAAPAFSAQAPTPEGYQPPQPSEAPERFDYADAIQKLADLAGVDQIKIPRSPGGNAGGGASASIHELFWNGPGAVNIDNGQRVGKDFVSGHRDHVHLAADRATMRRAKRVATSMGLHVGGFGRGISTGHAKNSYHYQPYGAMDVSGDQMAMRRFARRVARGRI